MQLDAFPAHGFWVLEEKKKRKTNNSSENFGNSGLFCEQYLFIILNNKGLITNEYIFDTNIAHGMLSTDVLSAKWVPTDNIIEVLT